MVPARSGQHHQPHQRGGGSWRTGSKGPCPRSCSGPRAPCRSLLPALPQDPEHCPWPLVPVVKTLMEGMARTPYVRHTPPPFVTPPLCNPPPPHGGDHHLAQKARETLGTKGAEENCSLGYTGTGGWGGGRHLVTPPPPRGGSRRDIRGGDYKGGGGYMCSTAAPGPPAAPAAPATVRRDRPTDHLKVRPVVVLAGLPPSSGQCQP